jgi:hypothetical protein
LVGRPEKDQRHPGYIVEWGDSLTPHSGDVPDGCNLPEGNVAGSIYKFPSTNAVGKQIDVSSWVVRTSPVVAGCRIVISTGRWIWAKAHRETC